jgi:hypothetical protein
MHKLDGQKEQPFDSEVSATIKVHHITRFWLFTAIWDCNVLTHRESGKRAQLSCRYDISIIDTYSFYLFRIVCFYIVTFVLISAIAGDN